MPRKSAPMLALSPTLPTDAALFDLRWARGLRDLTGPLSRLYGAGHDLTGLLSRLQALLRQHWDARPADLKALDLLRDLDPDWFMSEKMAAYVFYIDRFAGRLTDLPQHIPYLKDLGISYVHFMPCLKPRPGASDGGYAVMDYRAINPDLGTMAEFRQTAAAFRAESMSVCIDLVLNHTAKEHEWAEKAKAGDPFYQAFYRMYPDDRIPKDYEKTLVEIFPDQAPGNFTWYPEIGKWIWTTFNEYQWDLNWENPEVYLAIVDTILHLANQGVDVFRLDAVAFMWKRLGTNCQNLPEVHDILQALVQSTRVAAPGIIHKAEAIVGPAQLVPYLGTGAHEGRVSHLAYHNNLMVQYWASLASRDTRLMTHVMKTHFPENFRRASFATYIRCHDDIGWAITPEDTAYVMGMDAFNHRMFLADFYAGNFPGSFAKGADFQSNPETGDRRTNGSFASLAGLEDAIAHQDTGRIDAAIARILMGNALIASFGGIPLIYMGDEIGLLNDHSYLSDPTLAADGRWMHRPRMDWAAVARLGDDSPTSRIHAGTRTILSRRSQIAAFAAHVPTRILDLGHRALFAFQRAADSRPVTCLFNFSENAVTFTPWSLHLDPAQRYDDLLSVTPMQMRNGTIPVPPYGALWLAPLI